jgi:hypothetical protein
MAMRSMMKREKYGWRGAALIGVGALLLLLPWRAAAQELGKYELSAGYRYLRFDSSAGPLSMHGLNLAMARRVTPSLSLVGDGGGYHTEGFRLATALAGVRYMPPRDSRMTGFAQLLIGAAHANAAARGFPAYHESVAWMAGGGLDYRLNRRVSLRFAEVDYVQTRLGGRAQHNFRAGAGIAISFGNAQRRR